MSTVCFLMCVSSTHFFVGTQSNKYRERRSKSAGAIKLLEMVRQCNEYAPMYSVLPGLIFSTDDSTVFVFKGKSEKLDA